MNKPCLLLLLAVAVAVPSCLKGRPAAETRYAPWKSFQFREVTVRRSRSCQFRFDVPALADAEAEVRLLFELQPSGKDYYLVAVTRSGLMLGKVECGVEIPLARWTGDAPAAAQAPAGAGPPPGPFDTSRRLTVLRSPGRIAVAVGFRKVIELDDDTFVQGRAAIGCKGLAEAARPRVRARRAGEIYAADDFMRTPEEATLWTTPSGTWAIESVKHPGLSANAFCYAGRAATGGDAVALLGEDWWDDYGAEVSAKPIGRGGFGLVFRHGDANHYYLFRYTGAAADGKLQLVRVAGGESVVLRQRDAVLSPGQWYRLRVTACGRALTASVDGVALLRARDDRLSFGPVGLYVANPEGVEFDDLYVRDRRGLIEDFSGGRLAWFQKGGTWRVTDSSGARRLEARGPRPGPGARAAKLVGGEETWSDYRIAATLTPDSQGAAALLFRYRGESDHHRFTYHIDAGRYELAEVRNGKSHSLASAPAPRLDGPRSLAVDLTGGVIACFAGAERVLSHFDPSGRPGKAGLLVEPGAHAVFQDLAVTFPHQARPVLTHINTFARETTMVGWAAAESDWQKKQTTQWGEARAVHWHRGAFPGGGCLRVGAFFGSAPNGALRLYACAQVTSSAAAAQVSSGYELVVQATGTGDSAGRVKLMRDGREVAAGETGALRGKNHVALRNVQDYVVGEVNGRAVLAFRDEAPLRGRRSGYATQDVLVKPEDVEVYCGNTLAYNFVRAPAAWRTAGGEWMVTNRWRCDPRWSFMGGESLTGVAAMWNKTVVRGDLSVEVAAGIRHQASGKYSSHASDMNVTICGDGRSLTSGYGFMYGGWRNTKTAITRNGKVVAETTLKIPGNIHRRWFYFEVVKRGANLKYYIDNALVLEYTDPQPLPDGQVALWTWHNGLMVGRVRIAGDRLGPTEPLQAAYPKVSKTVYDN